MVTESVHVMSITIFEDEVDISDLEPVPRISSGLAIYTYFHYKIIISASNVVSTRNIGEVGANLLFEVNGKSVITVTNITQTTYDH